MINETLDIKKEADKVTLYNDFLTFLKLLNERPFEITYTGNLRLKEVKALGESFKYDIYKRRRGEKGEILSHFKTQDQCDYIVWLRQFLEVMDLTKESQTRLYLNKNGEGFLNIDKHLQYEQIIFHHFFSCNWEYRHFIKAFEDRTIADILQEHQTYIWKSILKKEGWINFKTFCKNMNSHFELSPLRDRDIEEDDRIEAILLSSTIEDIMEDLMKLGLIKRETKTDENGFKKTSRFRPTKLGIYFFTKALATLLYTDSGNINKKF